MINIKKILLFFCLFFLFNTLEIDSNIDKKLLYDKSNIYEENKYTIYFKNMNSIELDKILDKVKIAIVNYIIDDKVYYARNIDELTSKYNKDKELDEIIYNENKGIYIDGISVICEVGELIELEKLASIY